MYVAWKETKTGHLTRLMLQHTLVWHFRLLPLMGTFHQDLRKFQYIFMLPDFQEYKKYIESC